MPFSSSWLRTVAISARWPEPHLASRDRRAFLGRYKLGNGSGDGRWQNFYDRTSEPCAILKFDFAMSRNFIGSQLIGLAVRPAADFRLNATFTMSATRIRGRLTQMEQKGNNLSLSRRQIEVTMYPDKRSAWLQKLDEECPYQVVLPRKQLTDDNEIMNFLLIYAGKFDMYVEDECAAYVRYCFKDPMDAAIFRSRFEPKSEPFRLAG